MTDTIWTDRDEDELRARLISTPAGTWQFNDAEAKTILRALWARPHLEQLYRDWCDLSAQNKRLMRTQRMLNWFNASSSILIAALFSWTFFMEGRQFHAWMTLVWASVAMSWIWHARRQSGEK